MHIFIRADADGKIGTGHIMRCLALAQAWRDQEGEVTFIGRCESNALKERIQSEGCRFITLDRLCPDPADLDKTLAVLRSEDSHQRHWLVLDGYHFLPEYQQTIRDEGYRVMIIDDMNHLSHYHADILLNQNIDAPNLKYRCDQDTTLLLGNRYVLLRREFLKYRAFKRQIPKRAKNILVTLGGADPDNVTLKVIEALKLLGKTDISVRIIVGPANSSQKALRQSLVSAPFSAELLINPSDMPEWMAWADMAISAAGSTCWELAFMGVPIVTLILADNQKAVANGISKKGVAVDLGWHENFDKGAAGKAIDLLVQSKDRRVSMSREGQALIDASGGNRLCERLWARSISIRPIAASDCELIWRWANEPEVRKSSFCSDTIPFEDHERWFDSKINDPQSHQFIACDEADRPVGQVRFDETTNRTYDISVSIDKCFRKRGYGTEIIKQAIWELLRLVDVDVVHAYVKFDNSASKSVFLKAGFIREKDTMMKNTSCLHFVWKQK